MSYIIFLKVTFKLILRTLVRLFTALCKMVVLCICHKILHRYIYTMCMATKAYLLGRSLCNASHWPLKVYTFESERLFELFFCIEYSLKLFKQNKNHTSPYILLKLIIFCRRRKTYLEWNGKSCINSWKTFLWTHIQSTSCVCLKCSTGDHLYSHQKI